MGKPRHDAPPGQNETDQDENEDEDDQDLGGPSSPWVDRILEEWDRSDPEERLELLAFFREGTCFDCGEDLPPPGVDEAHECPAAKERS